MCGRFVVMGKAIPLVQPLWVAMIIFRMWSLGSRGDPMIAGNGDLVSGERYRGCDFARAPAPPCGA